MASSSSEAAVENDTTQTRTGANLALFDFDGTITRRELFPDFIRRAISRRRWFCGRLLLSPWIVGYQLGLVSGTTIRAAIVRLAFSGVPRSEVEAKALAFAQNVIPTELRDQAMARIDWHRRRGDEIVVVSGALDLYLAPWCAQQNLKLLCSSLAHQNGVLSGRYKGQQCVVDEKAARVRQAYDLSRFERIYAYGDTEEDRALLSLAHEAWFQWRALPQLQTNAPPATDDANV